MVIHTDRREEGGGMVKDGNDGSSRGTSGPKGKLISKKTIERWQAERGINVSFDDGAFY